MSEKVHKTLKVLNNFISSWKNIVILLLLLISISSFVISVCFFMYFYNFIKSQDTEIPNDVVTCYSWDLYGPKVYQTTAHSLLKSNDIINFILDYFVENLFLYYYKDDYRNKLTAGRLLDFIRKDYRNEFATVFLVDKIKKLSQVGSNMVILKKRRNIERGLILYELEEYTYTSGKQPKAYKAFEVTLRFEISSGSVSIYEIKSTYN